jgi:dynein heavy chain
MFVSLKADKTLAISDGTDNLLEFQAVYFVRSASGALNLETPTDAKLVYGELDKSPLADLESSLNVIYKPLLEGNVWGKANKVQAGEFMSEMTKFSTDLRESLKGLEGGIELQKPEASFIQKYESSPDNIDAEAVAHFEKVLEAWCVEVDNCINGDSIGDEANAGLMDELEYWRRRQQRLTSITEQLRTKECKVVQTCLNAFTKNFQEESRSQIFSLLRKWKQLDILLTEAANEAKDNAKYLSTLERFVEPLYQGTPTTIADTLPAMMTSIKMIHTIARYYNTTERMTNLFVKITNQMIEN